MRKNIKYKMLCFVLVFACLVPGITINAESDMWSVTFEEDYGEDINDLQDSVLTLSTGKDGSGVTEVLEADKDNSDRIVRKLKFNAKQGSEASAEGTPVLSSLSGFADSFTGDVKNRLSFDFKMEGEARGVIALSDKRANGGFADSPWCMFIRPSSIHFKPANPSYGKGTDWVEVLASTADTFVSANINTTEWNRVIIEIDKTAQTGYVYINDGREPIKEITTAGTNITIDKLATLCFETPAAANGSDKDPVFCIDNIVVEEFVGEEYVKSSACSLVGGGEVKPNGYAEGVLDYIKLDFYCPVDSEALDGINVYYNDVKISCQPAKLTNTKTGVLIYTDSLPKSGDTIKLTAEGVKLSDGREVKPYTAEFYAAETEKIFTISDLNAVKGQIDGNISYIANTSLVNTTDETKTAFIMFTGYDEAEGVKRLVDLVVKKIELPPQSKKTFSNTSEEKVSYSDGGEVYTKLLEEKYDVGTSVLPYYGHADGSGMTQSYISDGKNGYARKLTFNEKTASKEVYAGLGGLKSLKDNNNVSKMSLKFDMKLEGATPIGMFVTRGAPYVSQGHLTGFFGTDKAFGLWVAPYKDSGDYTGYSALTYTQASSAGFASKLPYVKPFATGAVYNIEWILDFENATTELYMDGQKLAEQTGLSNPNDIENLMFNVAGAIDDSGSTAVIIDNFTVSKISTEDSKCDFITLCVIDAETGLPLGDAVECN